MAQTIPHSLFVASLMIVSSASIAQITDAPDITLLPISIKFVPRAVPDLSLEDRYIRLVAVVPKQELTLSPDGRTYAEKLRQWFVETLIVKKSMSLLISVKPKIGESQLPSQAIFYQLQNGETTTGEYYGNTVLTPFSLGTGSPIRLVVNANYKTDVTSSMASTLISALTAAASLLDNPSKILTRLTTPSFASGATKVDAAIGSVFGASTSPEIPVEFDPRIYERIDLVLPNSKADTPPIVSVVIETRDSMISPNGLLAAYPIQPDDITKHRIFETVELPIAAYVRATPSLAGMVKMNTMADGMGFCDGLASGLADRGLNRYDRAASLYAYLVNSPWNRDSLMRDQNASEDACEFRVKDLTATNLAALLKPRDSLKPIPPVQDPNLDRLYNIRIITPLTEALSSAGSVRTDRWQTILADKVGIVTNGPVIALSPSISVDATKGVVGDPFDLPDLLNEHKIVWKSSTNCFTPFRNTQKTARFRTRDTCTSIKVADGRFVPVQIEFEYDNQMNMLTLRALDAPRISQMKIVFQAESGVIALTP